MFKHGHIKMGLMDMFRIGGGGGQQAPVQQPVTQPTQTDTNGAGAGDNTPTDANGKMPGTNQSPANPLDAYSKLFDNAANGNQDAPPSFNLDPKVVGETAGKMDFLSTADQELMTKAQGGDASAMIQLMNSVARGAYSAALQHSSTLTDKFVGLRSDYDSKRIGSSVKQELTTQKLSSLPNADHPVVKQQLADTARRLSSQYPDATPDWIADQARQYITDLASALNPNAGSQQGGQAAPKDTNWDEYFK